MFSILSRAKLFSGTKTAAAALIAATTLGVAAAPTSAYAGDGKGHHRHGNGYGAAAFGGGLLLGAIIASSNRDRGYDRDYDRGYGYDRECWNERQKRVNVYGEVSFRKVRVCE